jgi:hypothetical protein
VGEKKLPFNEIEKDFVFPIQIFCYFSKEKEIVLMKYNVLSYRKTSPGTGTSKAPVSNNIFEILINDLILYTWCYWYKRK